jgi:UDP-N-acetylmuramate: L-alanyl-gamma-D-glutamyl-meso-diaminopimelate ligase
MIAAMSIALTAGLPFKKVVAGVASFKGVKRRLETLYGSTHIKVIDDFGHNPVKVKASLAALRRHNPKSRIIVAFEPRTASSRRKAFQKEYPAAFSAADVAYIAEPFKKNLLDKDDVFSSKKLVGALKRKGVEAHVMKSANAIVGHIKKHMPKSGHSVIVTMSSGDFGGIREKLVKLVRRK